MFSRRPGSALALVFLLSASQFALGQVPKGYQILTNRGFQVQGMVNTGDPFNLNTYSNAHYTAINWLWDSDTSKMGVAPGFPWTRWVRTNTPTEMPPLGSESSFLSQLVTLQLGDEWDLNQLSWRDALVDWFNAVRANWPNTILYHNNYGGQVTDTNLNDFIARAQPDMISYDTYPWWYNNSHTSAGDTPIHWYGDARRYREYSKGYGIPLAIYMQTYYSTNEGTRPPSASELRLNHFAAMAFNAKVLIDFTYNTGASALFTNSFGGDNAPNSLYYEKADIASRARNLGKALVRLKPIADAVPNSYTTGMMFIQGKDPSGNPNPIPIGFLTDPDSPNIYTDWVYQRNDPYLSGWGVTNKGGIKNGGQKGDVIISWFTPLDETFDGPTYSNEVYMMVVNGLCATNGTAADCLQEINLDFTDTFGGGIELLDPVAGTAYVQMLPLVNSKRQLVLDLNGGDAVLFKFYAGAPFVGAQLIGAPAITAHPQSQTVNAGSNVLFTVTAAGNPAPTYRWRFNGNNIAGATNSSYTRTNAQSGDAGTYTVLVSNIISSVLSSNAVLTVIGAPSITGQPQSQAVQAGQTALFSVTAVGAAPLTYQWRKGGTNLSNGGNISGATNSTLAVSNVQSPDLGNYQAVVSNNFGSVTSIVASLSIATQPTISVQPQPVTTNAGSTVLFTVTASGNGLVYQWQRSNTNMVDGGNISGATTSALSLSTVTKVDALSYKVVITNVAGAVTSSTANLNISYPLPWSDPFNYPSGASINAQTSPNFLPWDNVGTNTAGPDISLRSSNLTVTGLTPSTGNSILFGGLGKSARQSFPSPFTSGTLYYSFALKVTDLTGASSVGGFVAGFNNSTGPQGNQPTSVGTRLYLRTTNSGFNLGLSKASSTGTDWTWDTNIFNVNQTIYIVGGYKFTTLATTNDDVANLWINPNSTNFGAPNPPNATLTTTNGPDIPVNQIASFVFFQRDATLEPAAMVADELRIDTTWAGVTPPPGPGITSQPQSRTNLTGTTATFSVTATGNYLTYQWKRSGTNLADGGNLSGALTSSLSLTNVSLSDAASYAVTVANSGGSLISSNATLTVNSPPVISTQPNSLSVPVGSNATFTVLASGTSPLLYQWRFNGTNLSSATNSAYTRNNVQRTNAGNYSVAITNGFGGLTSSNALLTVTPVTPVHVDSISVLPDGRAQLQVSGDPGYFIVQGSSNLLDWLDLTNILGASGTINFTDANSNALQRYYRAKLYP